MPVLVQVKIISSQSGGKLDHMGVRAQLLGTIELRKSGVKNHQFLSLSMLPTTLPTKHSGAPCYPDFTNHA